MIDLLKNTVSMAVATVEILAIMSYNSDGSFIAVVATAIYLAASVRFRALLHWLFMTINTKIRTYT